MRKEGLLRNPWSILARSCFPWTDDSTQSRWRSLSCMGRSCRTRSHLSNVRIRILSLQAKLVDHSQEVRKRYPTSKKTFWLQPSVVHIKPFTPRTWRTTTRARTLLEVQRMETGIGFLLLLVAMERILVVFLRIQRKSRKREQAKVSDRTGQPVVYRTLAKTSDKLAFMNSFYFVTDRLFPADGGLL